MAKYSLQQLTQNVSNQIVAFWG